MPLYDFECLVCSHIFEEIAEATKEEIPCPRCQNSSARKVWMKFPNNDWFKPFTTEEFEPYYGRSIEIRTKNHLKQLCLKHNVTNRALGDVRARGI